MIPRDLELLAQVEALVDAAKAESERYRKDYGFNTDAQKYQDYRSHCFMLIYQHFKTIAGEMEYEPSNYYQGLTMEENIDSFILACRAEHDGGWVSNVLKKIGRL